MKVADLITGPARALPELPDAENPFVNPGALVDARITRIITDVLGGTLGVLLELRPSTRFRGNTAVLRVTGVVQQDWNRTATANEFTAWSITHAVMGPHETGFQLIAECVPVGALRLTGSSAEFILVDARIPDGAPPDHVADPQALVRFGLADENTAVEPIGIARWTGRTIS